MASRRAFLGSLLAAAAAPALLRAQPRLRENPFKLGVASGYPHPSGFVLWTRLAGALDPVAIPVHWEVARDDAMRNVVASGVAEASPDGAHAVHVEPKGLEPDRWYWYRFRTGDALSAVGRTRTAPAPDAAPGRLRFAFASCQQYEHGYYGAYRHLVADAPDLVAFLGDYIYESSWGRERVRHHDAAEAFMLDDYRARYALYKSDPDLQAAHAACPWIATWDDHEVVNDYADDRAGVAESPEAFLARRAAAYQAYYEHLPLPLAMRPAGPRLRLHAELSWGSLARFYLLDDRQYRSPHACPQPRKRGGPSTVVDAATCAELDDPSRSMLGAAQERWLEAALRDSSTAWNVVAQQTRMAQWDSLPGPGRRAWTDGWDGYPLARRRLLGQLARVRNPVVIGGDVHAFNVAQLKADFDDPASPVLASEFVGTSVTSHGPAQERLAALLPENPHLLYMDSRQRGYVRVEVTPKLWRTDLRGMASVRERDASCSTVASFVVEDGRAGPVRAL
ncbi:MAG TPA: alkaline phosphatase D family protein [Burkholderiales bacterium]|nr:alkaline phosphatase D family protein [Burkholderiales bacterium]